VREPIVSQPNLSPSNVSPTLSTDRVEDLAGLVQVPILDPSMAERIAGGAAAAIAAVRASSQQVEPGVTFECEPSDYLRVLEALADEVTQDEVVQGESP
jgi:hypothetical protein